LSPLAVIALESPRLADHTLFLIISKRTHVDPEKVQSMLDSKRALEVYKNARLRQFLINSSSSQSSSFSRAFSIFLGIVFLMNVDTIWPKVP